MRSDIREGGSFPNYELDDQSGTRRSLAELQGSNPMVLHLSRGGFDPKEHQFVRRLVDMYPEFRNAYTRLALISTDIQYSMPTRSAVDPKDGQGFDFKSGLFAENHSSLSARVARLQTDQAWAEQPRSRTRHFISNIQVERDAAGQLKVTSALLLSRLRSNRGRGRQ